MIFMNSGTNCHGYNTNYKICIEEGILCTLICYTESREWDHEPGLSSCKKTFKFYQVNTA